MRRGLTLAEVVVAIGILAVAGLSVLAVFVKMVGAQSKSGHQVVARLLAEQVLEESCLAGPPNWGLTDPSEEQIREFQLEGAPEPIPFRYKLGWKVLRQSEGLSQMGALYGLDVTVTWEQEVAGQPSREKGRSSHTAHRVVYIEQ